MHACFEHLRHSAHPCRGADTYQRHACFSKYLIAQVALTSSDWDECSTFLTGLKRLIKAAQTLG